MQDRLKGLSGAARLRRAKGARRAMPCIGVMSILQGFEQGVLGAVVSHLNPVGAGEIVLPACSAMETVVGG